MSDQQSPAEAGMEQLHMSQGLTRKRYGDSYGSEPDMRTISDGTIQQLAVGLGWFSVGLGLAQLLAPDAVARMIGVSENDESRALMQVVGLREIAAGVGILASDRPTPWLWGRVGGDVMDLALLSAALNSDDTDKEKAAVATLSVLGITALDLLVSERFSSNAEMTKGGDGDDDGPEVRKYITVMRSVEEVYANWRDFSNLPRFMHYLESVETTGDGRSHWVAKAPLGRTVEWDAEIVKDVKNEHIAWRSLPGATVENSGSVHFNPAPGNRGTEVRVDIRYQVPGGKLVSTLSKLFPENPEREVYDDLRAFKQMLEVGEVVKSEALAGGSRLKQHSAQPLEPGEASS